MSLPSPTLVINGWTIFAHPLFLDTLEALTDQVAALQQKDPSGYINKNTTKRLAAINKLDFEVIPQNPADPNIISEQRWEMIANTGYAQNSSSNTDYFPLPPGEQNHYTWVNDENTKRAYDSDTDACQAFQRMLKNGNPPDD